jgi:hypothetical protein
MAEVDMNKLPSFVFRTCIYLSAMYGMRKLMQERYPNLFSPHLKGLTNRFIPQSLQMLNPAPFESALMRDEIYAACHGGWILKPSKQRMVDQSCGAKGVLS